MFLPTPTLQGQIDPRGTWHTWHTTHFRIHARIENSALAHVVAAEAERAYAALSTELKRPRGTIDVVMYDNLDFPNGFATVFPSNRITLYLTSPAGEIGLGRFDEWIRLVVTHELTHIFHLDRAEGVWGLAQHVFGRSPVFFPNLYRPAWVGEGLATYYESRFTGGGRERGAFHSQVLLGAVAENHWPLPGDANLARSGWPMGLGPYAFGARFWGWESATHGDSVVAKFVDHSSRRLWPLTISGPLHQSGGEDLYGAWKNFQADWAKKVLQPAEPAAATILERGLVSEPHPRLSPDGKRLAYVSSNGRSIGRIAVRDVQSGQTIATKRINSDPEIIWSGSDLIIAQINYTVPVEIRSRLHRWTPGGSMRSVSKVDRLTRPFAMANGALGAVLLHSATTTVVRVQGDSAVPMPVPDADQWSYLSLSPDGRQIAGARHANGQWDIAVWQVNDPVHFRLITSDPALDDDPSWSPDGSSVLFTSERSGVPQVYVHDLASSVTTQVTDEPTGAREGELTSDGTLFYTTILADGYALKSRAPGRVKPSAPIAERLPEIARTSVDPRETGYSPWGSLAPRYWMPLLHQVPEVADFVGIATSGSDIVGRTSYGVALAHALNAPLWEGLFALTYTRWASATLDLQLEQFWDLGGRLNVSPLAPNVAVSERDRLATTGITFRYQRWRSNASFRIGGEFSQDAFFVPDSFMVRFPNPLFAGGIASLSAGYQEEPPLSISAENGVVMNASYRHRWVTNGTGWSNETRGTLRGYLGLPFPGFAHWVLAGKVAAGISGGPNARNFALGGESSTALGFVPGVALGNGIRDFALRGYPRDVARFTRAVTTVAELRVPLFLIGRAVGRLPLSVDKVSFTVFGETGGAWRAEVGSHSVTRYRDVGGELVLDLGLNLDTPLRVRVGAAQALTAGLGAQRGDWLGYVAVGSSF